MRPTRAQVKAQVWGLLDDPAGAVFTDAGPSDVFQVGLNEAYEALMTALLTNQCPRLTVITTFTAPIMTTALTPADIGISDFGDYEYLAERAFGSQDKYIDLNSVDRLTQRQPVDRFMEFCYRNDTFYFIGNTTVRDMQLEYETSGEAPVDDATVINLDGCTTFLANYTVGVIGGRKGYEDTAARCMQLAVGPSYDLGTIGGELFRIVQHRVRSRQHVQISGKPYSATRRLMVRRPVPYVGVQPGYSGTTNVPTQYSTSDGTIIGPVNGINVVFWLITDVVSMIVYRNGVLMTDGGTDVTVVNNQITFTVAQTPQVGDILTASGYTV